MTGFVDNSDLARYFRNTMANARCYICGGKIGQEIRWHIGEVNNSKEIVHTPCFLKEAEEQKRVFEITLKTTPAIRFYNPGSDIINIRGQGDIIHGEVHSGSPVQAGESGEHHQRHVSGQEPPSVVPRSGALSFRGFRHDGEGK
jgi:hypothetical protein